MARRFEAREPFDRFLPPAPEEPEEKVPGEETPPPQESPADAPEKKPSPAKPRRRKRKDPETSSSPGAKKRKKQPRMIMVRLYPRQLENMKAELERREDADVPYSKLNRSELIREAVDARFGGSDEE